VQETMKLRCQGYGPNVTARDRWSSAAIMVGGTLVLTLAWMWLHVRFHDNAYVDSFSLMPFLATMALAMPLTYMKGRSAASRAICVSTTLAVLTAIFVLTGFIASRI
jgi:hypothetical protein